MYNNVKLLATCGVHASAIIEVLQKNQSKMLIMCIIWLMRQQQEDPTFYVDAHFEGQDNHFVRFCWMRPSQLLQLWDQFHDVVLLDTTAKMKRYSMILCVIILIDNYNRSHLAATALLSDETKDTFSWLFSSLCVQQHTIERLPAKESHFICHNEAIGKLPHFLNFKHHEMNQSMHYRCYSANLKEELERKFAIETPNGIFSEDMFDTNRLIVSSEYFTKEHHEEMTQKQQWGKGFGIMKKVLNLAITTGRVEELYEIHEKFSKELESEMAQTVQGNDVTEFAHTISNPLSIRTKGRKPKNVNGVDKVNLELNEGTEGEGESSESN
ncbi:unnamed protein product [Rhizophagus irregularis]|uniref:MULE transposase domain-containing protein n=1 Tax=Rhizophagus irregularis TaxID=588596 RepID=A0A916EHR9_9GLOM|nr:unnamed protein product [Rhizophagus irregularis]